MDNARQMRGSKGATTRGSVRGKCIHGRVVPSKDAVSAPRPLRGAGGGIDLGHGAASGGRHAPGRATTKASYEGSHWASRRRCASGAFPCGGRLFFFLCVSPPAAEEGTGAAVVASHTSLVRTTGEASS